MNSLADEIALQVLDIQYRHARQFSVASVPRINSYRMAWEWTCRVLPWLDRSREGEFLEYLKKHYNETSKTRNV